MTRETSCDVLQDIKNSKQRNNIKICKFLWLPIKAKPDFVTDPIDNPKSLEIME